MPSNQPNTIASGARPDRLIASSTKRGIRIAAVQSVPLCVAVITVAVFIRGLGNDFVEWDDYANFVNNQDFRGLAWKNLRWMFTTALMGQWIPLTWLTFGLDYVVWGMNPFGYHLTNLLLHTLAGVVLYFVARRLLGAATGWSGPVLHLSAAVAALFFAIHPLRAESVAWATERRDVLSGVWFLLTVLTYLKSRDVEPRRRGWLGLSVVCYALAVLSKSMVVTLPAILLVLDIYPFRRLVGRPKAWLTDRQARLVWLEKLPYFALAGFGIWMAFWAQRVNAFLTPLARLSIADRVVISLHSLWFYLTTTIMPLGLIPVYELPAHINPFERRFVVSALGAVLLTAAVVVLRRRWPAGLTAWAAYGIMLSPVSGIFHNGHQLVHDRYSYLPCLGWAILFGASGGAILRASTCGKIRPALARLAAGSSVLVLAGYAAITVHQVGVWHDTDSLWRFAVEADPTCAICHNNLGSQLLRNGLASLALTEFRQSVDLRPDQVRTNGNLGLAYLRTNRPGEAMQYFRKVLDRLPGDLDNRSNLAAALIDQRRLDEATLELHKVLRQDPNHIGANVNMGVTLIEAKRPAEAIPYLQRGLELKADVWQARIALVRAWLALGRPDLALQQYEAVKALDANAASWVAPWVIAEWS
jgi:tetratricopeptide (TPR) repeat protein